MAVKFEGEEAKAGSMSTLEKRVLNIESLSIYADELGRRVGKVADRVFGAEPVGPTEAPSIDENGGDGMIDNLDGVVDRLSSNLDRVAAGIRRLEDL